MLISALFSTNKVVVVHHQHLNCIVEITLICASSPALIRKIVVTYLREMALNSACFCFLV